MAQGSQFRGASGGGRDVAPGGRKVPLADNKEKFSGGIES